MPWRDKLVGLDWPEAQLSWLERHFPVHVLEECVPHRLAIGLYLDDGIRQILTLESGPSAADLAEINRFFSNFPEKTTPREHFGKRNRR